MREVTLRVEDMHLEVCARRIRNLLERQLSVLPVHVSAAEARARVRRNQRTVEAEQLVVVIEDAGFDITVRW